MKGINATEASRHSSERIAPRSGLSGSEAKGILRRHRPDLAWSDDLRELRSHLEREQVGAIDPKDADRGLC
jgi:hypothetical protein